MAILGATFFYAYLAVALPEKFGPLKIFYFLMAFVFMIAVFWAVLMNTPDQTVQFTVLQNVTYNATIYETNATIIQLPHAAAVGGIMPEFIIANAIIVLITVLFLLYLYSKEMMLKPLQDVYRQVESQDKSKPKGGF